MGGEAIANPPGPTVGLVRADSLPLPNFFRNRRANVWRLASTRKRIVLIRQELRSVIDSHARDRCRGNAQLLRSERRLYRQRRPQPRGTLGLCPFPHRPMSEPQAMETGRPWHPDPSCLPSRRSSSSGVWACSGVREPRKRAAGGSAPPAATPGFSSLPTCPQKDPTLNDDTPCRCQFLSHGEAASG